MQRFLVALLTVAVFAAGFGARVWTEKASALPAPPSVQGIEFTPTSATPRGGPPRMSRTEMIKTITENTKTIEVYRNRVDELDKEMELKLQTILTPDQKKVFAEQQRNQNDFISRMKAQPASTELLSDEQLDRLRNNPLNNVLRMMQVKGRAARLKDIYDLSPEQQTQAMGFLSARRDQFIKLLDETPNPSVRYSDLAQVVQRIANPALLEQEKKDKEKRDAEREKAKKVEEGKK